MRGVLKLFYNRQETAEAYIYLTISNPFLISLSTYVPSTLFIYILTLDDSQVGGSLAKVVYFTRSPEPPASPSIAATNGSSVASGVTTPSSQSSNEETTFNSSPVKRLNGALTPLVLESSNNNNNGNHVHTGYNYDEQQILRDALVRRASLRHFPGGSLNFERFETDNIAECVEFIQALIERSAQVNGVSIEEMRKGVKIMATGGGAHKFYELFSRTLSVEVRPEDEMECLIEGLKFITLIPNEVYYFSDELVQKVSRPTHGQQQETLSESSGSVSGPLERPTPNPPEYGVTFEANPSPQLPCLLVNIGSGVSIIKVDEDGKFERVSGTSLGGGTLWGLLSLLTPARTFDGAFSETVW